MGTGDSGKTTFVEQAQSPVANAVSDQAFILRNLQWNAIDSIQALLREVDRLGVAFSGEMKNQERIVKAFQTNGDPPQEYTEQLVSGICALWESLKVQQVYAQRNKFWLPENASYYITHAQRFASAPFEPTEEDRALAARRTLWVITSHIFEQQPCKFHIADMGGLRGVRRKWALCVQDPAALVYMTALTGYHRGMYVQCDTF
jgi:guanine nucleotide-binding protein subunit alpha